MTISTWFRKLEAGEQEWARGTAECRKHPHLPWTADYPPDSYRHSEMYAICTTCPVITKCAEYAMTVNGGMGADGGFYAGVWLPWRTTSGDPRIRHKRRQARNVLRTTLTKVAGL